MIEPQIIKRPKLETEEVNLKEYSLERLPTDILQVILKIVSRERHSCTLINKRFMVLTEQAFSTRDYFESRFPQAASLKKSFQTTDEYSSNDFKELCLNQFSIQMNMINPKFITLTRNALNFPVEGLIKDKTNQYYAIIGSFSIKIWNKKSELKQNLSLEIDTTQHIAIDEGRFIASLKDGRILILEIENGSKTLLELPGFSNGIFEIYGDFLINISSSLPIILIFNLKYPESIPHRLEIPTDLISNNGTVDFRQISNNRIVIVKDAAFHILQIDLEKKYEVNDEQEIFSLRKIELINQPVINSNKGYYLFSGNTFYYHSCWETQRWDLKSGEKLSNLPDSAIIPIITDDRIVTYYKNYINILNRNTLELLATQPIDNWDMIPLISAQSFYSMRGFDFIDFTDGLITSTFFVINTMPNSEKKQKFFHTLSAERDIKLKINFPDGMTCRVDQVPNILLIEDPQKPSQSPHAFIATITQV